ncbi:hypothetical protein [Haliangium sp.]|uniref:hypothetical protein n=1 Tax=Haliangium sp. TaxID=2663208 RepID=UPI003D14E71C
MSTPRPPALFSDHALLDDSLPAAWQPLRALLAELEGLLSDPDDRPLAQRRAVAAPLRDRILTETARLVAAAPDAHPIAPERHLDWFADAVLLWSWFAHAGGHIRLDTLGAETLPEFPVDFKPDDADRALLTRALGRVTGLDPAALQDRARRLRRLTSNLELKRAITAAIADRVRAADDADAAVLDLFRSMYGELPFRPGDIRIVCASALSFFCIPIAEDGGLDLVDFGARPDADQDRIRTFLHQAQKANLSAKQVRFPAFGLFDLDRLDPALLHALWTTVRAQPGLEQVSERVLAETLATMVIIVPAAEAEMFLVHDVWGHGWQETLCEFEWLFADFRHLDAALGPNTGADADGVGGPRLADAFPTADGAAVLDRAVLDQVVERDLRRRIKIGLNLAASECFADLIEHKFVRLFGPERGLPSSSLVPTAPLRMDLNVTDLKRAARMWRKPYLRLRDEPGERARLGAALVQAGVSETGLDQALREAAEHIADRFAHAFSTRIGADADAAPGPNGTVPTTVIERALCSVVTLDGELDALLARGQNRHRALRDARGPDTPRWHCPPACIDLIALVLGWYYDQDHAVVLWHLDELLRDEIWPSLIALEQAILAELDGAG